MSTGDPEDDEPLPSLATGALIADKYRIERLIGQGGMGSVWCAVHVSLGQRVAVKLIAKRFAASREARHRFDLEAKAVAQLRSRYVVQVYDHGETADGTPYIVMEYLEGESLDARVDRGPLPLAAASVILDQIGRALGRAHALGMVHRDLKPENVFITTSPDGDGEIAKVLDFGIVKMRGHEGIGSTRTGAVLGTPLYMSPEQARGLKTVDHHTDIYSLGMVAYTMLTGQPAFTGESLGDLLVAICTEPLPDIRRIAHWLPSPVDAWFQRACAREPAARFESVEEMTAAFSAAAGLVPGVVTQPPHVGSISSGGSLPSGSVGDSSQLHAVRASVVSNSVGAVPVATTPPDLTAAPFSVTGVDIPKRSLALPIAIAAGVVALAAAFALARLGRTPTPEPASGGAVAASAPAPSVEATTAVAASTPEPSVSAVVAQGPAKKHEPKVAKPEGTAAKPEKTSAKPETMRPDVAAAKPTAAPEPAVVPPAAVPPAAAPPAKPPKPSHVDLGF
jgi:serine/threonine-protein kinase